MALELRPYQRQAIDSIYNYFRSGNDGHPLVVAPTGCGKSLILSKFAEETLKAYPNVRILILAHRKELLQQNLEKLQQFWPQAPVGVYSAGLKSRELGYSITVAGVASIFNKARQLGWVDIVIIDECFVAGTKISTPMGGRDIDLMRCGDSVYSAYGVSTVSAVSARKVTSLIEVTFSDGKKLTCTENHPFFTQRGWVEARALDIGEIAFSEKGLRVLLEGNYADSVGERGDTIRKVMEKAKVLLNILRKEVREPDEQSSDSVKNARNIKKGKTSPYKAWRERAAIALASACPTPRARGGLGVGSFCTNNDGAPKRGVPESLQDRHSKQGEDDCSRNRRVYPCLGREARARQEKNRPSYFPRVVSVSRIESESPRTVYNLQVSGHPSYFANGKLVHNCHLLSNDEDTMYRKLVQELSVINSKMKVIGLTATPYRMKTGMLTDPGGIFTDIAYDIELGRLVKEGYLSPLISKIPKTQADLSAVKVRGGEFVAADAERAMDIDELTEAAICEMETYLSDRRSWLIFCTGVAHAAHVCEALRLHGHDAEYVVGESDDIFRAATLARFRNGQLKCLVNCDVLTTGFDAPNIDAVVLLRPTKSVGLYVQMLGRGSRLHPDKENCCVLDFAGNIERHGPVDCVRIQKKAGGGKGVTTAPVKTCPECNTAIAISVMHCPVCGYEFEEKQKHDVTATTKSVMVSLEPPQRWSVSGVTFKKHNKAGSAPSLRVMYECQGAGNLQHKKVSEWVCLEHRGFAHQKAVKWWLTTHRDHKTPEIINVPMTIEQALEETGDLRPVTEIVVQNDGKFDRVLSRTLGEFPADTTLNPWDADYVGEKWDDGDDPHI